MSHTRAVADVHDLVMDAKRFSARTQIVDLGYIAEKFAARYAAMDEGERTALRTEFPGTPKRKYEHGWIGAWNRMIACDPDLVGDASICARTMVRCLKFLPIARVLVKRERSNAIPLKLSGSCEVLQRALALVHGADTDAHERLKAIDAIADGIMAAYEIVGKALTTSSAHGAVMNESIVAACLDLGVDIGEAPAPKPPRAKKRVRGDKEDSEQKQQTDVTTDVGDTAAKDWGQGANTNNRDGGGGVQAEEGEVDGTSDEAADEGAHKADTLVPSTDTLEAKVAQLAEDDQIAKEIVRRLEMLVPGVHREVMDDMSPHPKDPEDDCSDGEGTMES